MARSLDTVENSIGGTNPVQGLIPLKLVWQKQHPQPYPDLLWLSPLTNCWSLGWRVDLKVVTKVSLPSSFPSLSLPSPVKTINDDAESNDVDIPHPSNSWAGRFAMILMVMMIMLIAAWGVKAREEEGQP